MSWMAQDQPESASGGRAYSKVGKSNECGIKPSNYTVMGIGATHESSSYADRHRTLRIALGVEEYLIMGVD